LKRLKEEVQRDRDTGRALNVEDTPEPTNI